jgi:hypothetical protein
LNDTLPANASVRVFAISPDSAHVVYTADQ